MFAFDMTNELTPFLFGMNALLIASAMAVLGAAVMPTLRTWLTRRPHLTLHRPALAGHASR